MSSDITLMDGANGAAPWHQLRSSALDRAKQQIFHRNPEYFVKQRYFNELVSSSFASLFSAVTRLRQAALDVHAFTRSSAAKQAVSDRPSALTGAVDREDAPLGEFSITVHQTASGQELVSEYFAVGGSDLPQTGGFSATSGTASPIYIEYSSPSAQNLDILDHIAGRINSVEDSPVRARVQRRDGEAALRLIGLETGDHAVIRMHDLAGGPTAALFPLGVDDPGYEAEPPSSSLAGVDQAAAERFPSNTLFVDFGFNLAWAGPIRIDINPYFKPPEGGRTAVVTVDYADRRAAAAAGHLTASYNTAQSAVRERSGFAGQGIEALADSVDRFITAYNSTRSFQSWRDMISGTPRTIQSGLAGVYIDNRTAMSNIGVTSGGDGRLEFDRNMFLSRFETRKDAESALKSLESFSGAIYSYASRISRPVFDKVRINENSVTYIVADQLNLHGFPGNSLAGIVSEHQVFNNRFSGFFLNVFT